MGSCGCTAVRLITSFFKGLLCCVLHFRQKKSSSLFFSFKFNYIQTLNRKKKATHTFIQTQQNPKALKTVSVKPKNPIQSNWTHAILWLKSPRCYCICKCSPSQGQDTGHHKQRHKTQCFLPLHPFAFLLSFQSTFTPQPRQEEEG